MTNDEPKILLAVLKSVNKMLHLPGMRFVIRGLGFLIVLGLIVIGSTAEMHPLFYDLKAYVDFWEWVKGFIN